MEKVYPSLATSVAAVEHPLSTESRSPAEAAQALEMLGEGKTFMEVARSTGLSLGQVAALRKRHKVALEEHRERFASDGVELAEKLRLVANAKLEQLAHDPEQLARTNIKDLILPYAIAQDKVFAALGENTVVVEHRSRGVSLEDAQKAIEDARKRLREVSVEVKVEPC